MRDSTLSVPYQTTDEASSPPRMNRRQAAKIRTRAKVVEAARNLFAERGYDPATIRDIAKGAGMSTGAVFANFQDKAELFETVLTEDMERMAEVLKRGAEVQGSTRDRLLSALSAGYHQALGQLPLVQAIIARSWFQPLAAEMRARAATKTLHLTVAEILRDGVSKGELRQDVDVPLLGEMIWDAYQANYRKAAYDSADEQSLSKRLAEQLDVILAGAVAR